MKKIHALLVVFIFSTSCIYIIPGQGATNNDTPQLEPFPVLRVKKWIDEPRSQVLPGDSITIFVNITNFGKSSAFDLTIDEPIFQTFAAEYSIPYESHFWAEVESNSSIFYSFSFSFAKIGTYSIESTVVTFSDENGTKLTSSSNYLPVDVIETVILVNEDSAWFAIFIWMLLLLFLPVIAYLINRFFFEK